MTEEVEERFSVSPEKCTGPGITLLNDWSLPDVQQCQVVHEVPQAQGCPENKKKLVKKTSNTKEYSLILQNRMKDLLILVPL